MKIGIRIRSIIIYMMIFSLFLNATAFASSVTSSLYWITSLLALISIVGYNIHSKLWGRKEFASAAIFFLGTSLVSIIISVAMAKNNSMNQLAQSMKIWLSYIVNIFFLL